MKKIGFYMFLMMILFLTDYSHSLDVFELNGKIYEFNGIDIGKEIGCEPGFMFTVVMRNSSSQKEIWSKMTVEQAKEIWIQKGKCWPSISSSYFKHLWNRGKFVDFVVISQNCGASCPPSTVTIYRFDGVKVTKIEAFTALKLKLDLFNDQIEAGNQINEGQCQACPKRWKRDIYKWDGYNYRKIKSEETKKTSDSLPW